jgi:hypothetical protein
MASQWFAAASTARSCEQRPPWDPGGSSFIFPLPDLTVRLEAAKRPSHLFTLRDQSDAYELRYAT